MSTVFYLQHTVRRPSGSNRKGIGVYSSVAKASSAMQRVIRKPGFRNQPDGFAIYACVIDKSYWPNGYDSTANIHAAMSTAHESSGIGLELYQAYFDVPDQDDEAILIGLFTSEHLARKICDGLRKAAVRVGEFDVSTIQLDVDNWVEGFGEG
ncbi:MAG: hypothetical protein ACKVP7_27420 [Hyphomicrobiaceae bacterium]